MTPILRRLAATFESIPHDLIAIIARISIGTVFWRSAMTKIEGLSLKPSTFYLFENDYRLPLVPPEAAAYLATATELTMPLLLWSGVLTRFAATILLGMTLVIQLFVIPGGWPEHLLWFAVLLLIIARGPGVISLDHLIWNGIVAMPKLARSNA